MKYIKLFDNFNSNMTLEDDLKYWSIENYTINKDGSVDVYGDVDLANQQLEFIPIKFGKVSGIFNCSRNPLNSLENCPYYVGKEFYCSAINIKSLEFSPREIGGSFYCHNNKLESIEGMPLEIGGDFDCSQNPNLKELKSISYIGCDIVCDYGIDTSKFEGYCRDILELGRGETI